MVALREKITAWLFVLNSCLRASNCSRRSSSPVGRLPAAGLLLATAPVQQGALWGDHSPDSPTASHRESASSTPSVAPAKTVLQAPRCGKGECPGGTAPGKHQGWVHSPGEGEAALLGHLETWHGATQPVWDIPAACCRLHIACCMVRTAHQGCSCGTLHLIHCTLHMARWGWLG